MKIKLILITLMLSLVFGVSCFATGSDPLVAADVYIGPGGDILYVKTGGEVMVESGGSLDIESGGAFEIAGVAVTSSAAELNKMNGVTATASELNTVDVTAGTLTASKAVVVDAASNIDAFEVVGTLQAGDVTLYGDITNATSNLGIVNITSTGTISTTRGVTGGTAAQVGGIVHVAVAASTAVSATTTETIFDNSLWQAAADELTVGTVIRYTFWGIVTADNSSDTLAIELYIGGISGTPICVIAASDVAANDIFKGSAIVTIRTIGSSGTFVATNRNMVPAATGFATTDGVIASTAVNTEGTLDFVVSAVWSSTNAGNSCRIDGVIVEIKGF